MESSPSIPKRIPMASITACTGRMAKPTGPKTASTTIAATPTRDDANNSNHHVSKRCLARSSFGGRQSLSTQYGKKRFTTGSNQARIAQNGCRIDRIPRSRACVAAENEKMIKRTSLASPRISTGPIAARPVGSVFDGGVSEFIRISSIHRRIESIDNNTTVNTMIDCSEKRIRPNFAHGSSRSSFC